jgi:hypothetical protein
MKSIRAIADRLKTTQGRDVAQLARAGDAVTSAARENGMKFKVDDRVLDLATGKGGVVRVAEPRAGRQRGLYGVLLDDARSVLRGEDELTADAPPTTVPA